MATLAKEISDQRKAALTAGASLIIMAFAAFFSAGFVHERLVVQGDASATFNNIISSNTLFKAGIMGWLIILISDIVVAWAFYIFLKPIHQHLSLLGAWFRLIYSATLGMAIMNLLFVLQLTNSSEYLSLLANDQLQEHVMLFMDTFDSIWSIGLIIFGGHLLIVGWLAFKSDHIPKVISILLLIASIGYMVIHFCNTLLPQFEGIVTILNVVFTLPMIAGELGFGLWLLFRGGKVPIKSRDS